MVESGAGMRDPIEVLQDEHQLISRVLEVIEREVERIDQGNPPRVELIESAARFLAEFADERHHAKEERFLFPMLASKKDIVRNGPVKVLTSEHESGRYFVRELREGIAGLSSAESAAAPRIRRALALSAQMLRKHIAKEEDILFLLAQVLLSEDEIEELATSFQGVDASYGEDRARDQVELVSRMEALARAET